MLVHGLLPPASLGLSPGGRHERQSYGLRKEIAYSPYISELNGDNRERYRETLVQLCHEIEPIYSSLKNNN